MSILDKFLFVPIFYIIYQLIFTNFNLVFSLLADLIKIFTALWITNLLIKKFNSLNKKVISPQNKAVLVTGCDSGFGHGLALKLNAIGFRVYATVLDPTSENSQQLSYNALKMDEIKVIKMDVTNDEDIKNSVNEIKSDLIRNKCVLWAVVNNAGIGGMGLFEWGTIETYKSIMEVNTFGTVRVTKAFISLIRESRGRIVNNISLAGRITDPLNIPYSMSKHAILSFTDGLRRSMHKWGVKVSIIEPSFYRTKIISENVLAETFEREWNETPDDVKQVYGQNLFESLKSKIKDLQFNVGEDINEVIDAMIDAIMNTNPEITYTVVHGLSAKLIIFILRAVSTRLQDMFYFLRDKNQLKMY